MTNLQITFYTVLNTKSIEDLIRRWLPSLV